MDASNPFNACEVIHCQKSAVGRVIGQHGRTIKAIQILTSAWIKVDQTSYPDVRIGVFGSPQAVEYAASIVSDIVNDTFKGFAFLRQLPTLFETSDTTDLLAKLTASYRPGYGFLSDQMHGPGVSPGSDQPIPSMSNATHDISSAAYSASSSQQYPPGPTYSSIVPPVSSQHDDGSGPTVQTVSCSRSCVGRILGKHGQTVKALQMYTQTSITVDQGQDPCVLSITGNASNVAVAESMLHDIAVNSFQGYSILRHIPVLMKGGLNSQSIPAYVPGYGLAASVETGQPPAIYSPSNTDRVDQIDQLTASMANASLISRASTLPSVENTPPPIHQYPMRYPSPAGQQMPYPYAPSPHSPHQHPSHAGMPQNHVSQRSGVGAYHTPGTHSVSMPPYPGSSNANSGSIVPLAVPPMLISYAGEYGANIRQHGHPSMYPVAMVPAMGNAPRHIRSQSEYPSHLMSPHQFTGGVDGTGSTPPGQ